MISLNALLDSDLRGFVFLETDEGRKLLFLGGELVALQRAAKTEEKKDGSVLVEAEEWEFSDEKYHCLYPIISHLHDEPSFPVLPEKTNEATRSPRTVYHVHGITLVDEDCWEDENQLLGDLEAGPSFLLTVTTEQGLESLLLTRETDVFLADFDEKQRLRRRSKVEVWNLRHLRDGVRKWLAESLGEEWHYFK